MHLFTDENEGITSSIGATDGDESPVTSAGTCSYGYAMIAPGATVNIAIMIIGARFRRKENDAQDEDGHKLSPSPHASITESLQMN